jgi:hypothetical protein
MKIGLLLNSDNRLFPNYSEKFREILDANRIPYICLDPNSNTFPEDLSECSHLLFRHSQGDTDMMLYDSIFYLAHVIYHLKCSPGYPTYYSYENKIREYYLLKSKGFPVVETRVFWNYDPAIKYLDFCEFPLVVKLYKGASSSNVVKISTKKQGHKILKKVFSDGVKFGKLPGSSNLRSIKKLGIFEYTYLKLRSVLLYFGIIHRSNAYEEWQIQEDSIIFQKYLPGNDYDTRITVIGNRAFGFRRFVRDNDFRASGSGKLDLNPEQVDLRCVRIALDISKSMNFETMAYDFIYDQNREPRICEISYCFVDKVLAQCTGFWDEKLEWHSGSNWPQYYQLQDFTGLPDLKSVPLPEIF